MKKLVCTSYLTLLMLTSVAQGNRVTLDPIDTMYLFNGMSYEMYDLGPISPDTVIVTSELASSSNRYSKAGLTDGDYTTAWVEGKQDGGVGEKITIGLSIIPDVMAILPGYYKSDQLWQKNNRVSKLKVRMLQASNAVIEELKIDMITDSAGVVPRKFQYINMSDLAEQNMEYEDFGGVEIEIDAVDSINSVYSDTCISEIIFMRRNKYLGQLSAEDYKSRE